MTGKFREYAKENPGMFNDHFAIERVGLFTYPSGLSPLTVKIPTTDKNKPENSRYRGPQFITSGLKTKDGTCDAYFDKEFKRIFEKEAIPKPRRKKKELPHLPMIPTSPTKLHSTPGDGYGCFSTYSHFSFNKLKKSPKKKKEAFIPILSGGPPGYFNEYPEALDPRLKKSVLKQKNKKKGFISLILNHKTADFFDPNPYFTETPKSTYILPKDLKKKQATIPWIPVGEPKEIGGAKFGTFDTYPDYFSPRERKKSKKLKLKSYGYGPQVWANTVTSFTPSVTQKVIDMQCNHMTYLDYKPTHVSKYLPNIGE